jgi:hypothetical protein
MTKADLNRPKKPPSPKKPQNPKQPPPSPKPTQQELPVDQTIWNARTFLYIISFLIGFLYFLPAHPAFAYTKNAVSALLGYVIAVLQAYFGKEGFKKMAVSLVLATIMFALLGYTTAFAGAELLKYIENVQRAPAEPTAFPTPNPKQVARDVTLPTLSSVISTILLPPTGTPRPASSTTSAKTPAPEEDNPPSTGSPSTATPIALPTDLPSTSHPTGTPTDPPHPPTATNTPTDEPPTPQPTSTPTEPPPVPTEAPTLNWFHRRDSDGVCKSQEFPDTAKPQGWEEGPCP